jgi:hypothetical protein
MATQIHEPALVYTDAPRLNNNLVTGSLRLLFWLLVHPSAWRQYVVSIDPTLSPNFLLTDLSWEQWRNRRLHRLLAAGFVVLPLLAALLTGLILLVIDPARSSLPVGLGSALIFGTGIMLVSSLTIGAAIGLVLVVGVGAGGGLVAATLAQQTAASLTGNGLGLPPAEALGFGAALGVMLGLGAGAAGLVASSTSSDMPAYPFLRRLAAIIVGIPLASLMLVLGGWLLRGNVNVILVSLLMGAISWMVVGWRRGFGVGLAVGLLIGLYLGLAFATHEFLARMVLLLALLLPVYILTRAMAGPWLAIIASALGTATGWVINISVDYQLSLWPMLAVHLGAVIVGLALPLWGPLLSYPALVAWNWLLYRVDVGRRADDPILLHRHSVFWDERQPLRLIGLDRHLLTVYERNAVEGQAAINYLATRRQRWAAQSAQIELDAQSLERCLTVQALSQAHCQLAAGGLTGPTSALLRSFSRISQDVMAALEQGSTYNQRLALSAVEDRLDGLLRELTRSSERYALRFRPIAAHWRQLIADHGRALSEAVEARQEIDSPYVIGIPLTEQQEIFVGRTNISSRIEKLLIDQRRPPLLLYGQRRMGKTSLLNNLSRLLPSTIVPLFVDLQGPASHANDYTGFFYNIARSMIGSAQRQRSLTLPPLPRDKLAIDAFTVFDEWLDEVEIALADHTALVTLDEFEALEAAIERGRLDGQELLSMLRHLIQHRPRFKILLTSSQTLEEFQRWSSYLINVQVVHLSYLNPLEARHLIEAPVKDFPLRYEVEASRQVLNLTHGHPFLVQLLCDEIVALKNEQRPAERRLARLADVEAAAPEALARGSFFFADIERNQVDQAGLAVLRFLATHGEGAIIQPPALEPHCPGDLERTLLRLTRRELIERVNGGYRFQVELVRRWFVVS